MTTGTDRPVDDELRHSKHSISDVPWTQVFEVGGPLDAHFRIEAAENHLDLVIQSRGGRRGSPEARNSEYSAGLQVLLERLGRLGGTIAVALVDSSHARKLPESSRRIVTPRGYPIALAQVPDLGSLKGELMKGQATVARAPGASTSGGNSTKRVRFCLTFEVPMSRRDLEAELSGRDEMADRSQKSLTVEVAQDDDLVHRSSVSRSVGTGSQTDPSRSPHAEMSELGDALTAQLASALELSTGSSMSSYGLPLAPIDLVAFLDSMAGVGTGLQRLQEALSDVAARAGLSSARSRIRSYLLQHIGEPVTTYELNGVSGIQASARRIRELREEGLSITSGPSQGLAPGEYRLEAGEWELVLAARWRRLNAIRASKVSGAQRVLCLLEEDHPRSTSRDDLRVVVAPDPLQTAVDELELDGWSIIEETEPASGTPSLRLASLRRTANRTRRSTRAREAVLTRDRHRCRRCGASAASETNVILHVHRNRPASDPVKAEDDALETVCSRCHCEIHRSDGIDGASDEVLFPHRNPWLSY